MTFHHEIKHTYSPLVKKKNTNFDFLNFGKINFEKGNNILKFELYSNVVHQI